MGRSESVVPIDEIGSLTSFIVAKDGGSVMG